MCKEANAPGRQKELAAWLEVSQPTVSDYKNAKLLPSMDKAIQMAEKLGCNVEWLLTGRGEKYPVNKSELLLDISRLSEKDRDIVKSLVKSLEVTTGKEVDDAQGDSLDQNKQRTEIILINNIRSNATKEPLRQ